MRWDKIDTPPIAFYWWINPKRSLSVIRARKAKAFDRIVFWHAPPGSGGNGRLVLAGKIGHSPIFAHRRLG